MRSTAEPTLHLFPDATQGDLEHQQGEAPIAGATWYLAKAPGDGLVYHFPKGALAKARYLTFDLLLDHSHISVFDLDLKEGDAGRTVGRRAELTHIWAKSASALDPPTAMAEGL
jgi:hypothetical protein